MLLTFYNVFFGKDGHIYFNKENRREFIRECDFKRSFLGFTSEDTGANFKFWTSLLNNTVYFEEGSNVESVWRCLSESADFWSSLLGIDVRAYIKEFDKPKTNEVFKNQYDSIIAFNLPSLKLESYDGANFYHIRMNYGIRGFSNKKGINTSEAIAHIPLNEIKDLPFYFERIDGVFLEEDVKPKTIANHEMLLNYYKEAKVNDAIYAIFGHCFRSPEHRDNRLVSKINMQELEKQRNQYNDTLSFLKDSSLLPNRDIIPMKLPENVSKSCSTFLPYALKKCK